MHHLFVPRESNNHRASLLHHQTLFIYIIAFIIGSFLISIVKTNYSQVLGDATDISVPVLLELTNQKRQEDGLEPLTINEQLSKAAEEKADYMFAHNFWAHHAPDGTTPWYFIKDVGYQYIYAGENLARGFSTSGEVVGAWMASPTHRQNILSSNYKDIGFAVKSGKLLGEDTVLVVEMFGSTSVPVVAEKKSRIMNVPNKKVLNVAVQQTPLINGFQFTWNITTFVLALFIAVLIIDMLVVKRKKIVRLVGHNGDHILYLGMLLVFVVLFTQGVVL